MLSRVLVNFEASPALAVSLMNNFGGLTFENLLPTPELPPLARLAWRRQTWGTDHDIRSGVYAENGHISFDNYGFVPYAFFHTLSAAFPEEPLTIRCIDSSDVFNMVTLTYELGFQTSYRKHLAPREYSLGARAMFHSLNG